MNRIEIYGTPMEYVFDMYYSYIMDACGDGGALLVCKNYEGASNLFIDWWRKKRLPLLTHKKNSDFFHPRDEYTNIINYHDWNENFMFSDTEQEIGEDATFIIREDCYHYGNKDIVGYARLESVWN